MHICSKNQHKAPGLRVGIKTLVVRYICRADSSGDHMHVLRRELTVFSNKYVTAIGAREEEFIYL